MFYKGVDNMISTLCDIHNIMEAEAFALVFIEEKRVLLLKEKLLTKIKKVKHAFAMLKLIAYNNYCKS